jgi:hypothetical protein
MDIYTDACDASLDKFINVDELTIMLLVMTY